MINATRCFEAHCDNCGDGYSGSDEAGSLTAHYHDRAQLERALRQSDWTQTGERLVCPRCARAAACALVGHRWGPWNRVTLPDYRGRRRDCMHCDAADYDPPRETNVDEIP